MFKVIIKANNVFLIVLVNIGIIKVIKYINDKFLYLLRLKIILYIITAEITKYKLSVPPQPSDIINSEPLINILLPTRYGSDPIIIYRK